VAHTKTRSTIKLWDHIIISQNLKRGTDTISSSHLITRTTKLKLQKVLPLLAQRNYYRQEHKHTENGIEEPGRVEPAAARRGAYFSDELGPRFLPKPTTAVTNRRLYCILLCARPRGFFFLSCFATLGVWPRTFPARASDPCTLPMAEEAAARRRRRRRGGWEMRRRRRL